MAINPSFSIYLQNFPNNLFYIGKSICLLWDSGNWFWIFHRRAGYNRVIVTRDFSMGSLWESLFEIPYMKLKQSLHSVEIPWNSENKPGGLYFSKALFEGLIFGGAYIRRGLSTEGNLRFKIDWASLTVGSKFTIFALFYLMYLRAIFQVQAPKWLIFGGAI